jgi:RpiR family carbohydrate utilization transcriptional regulator
LDIVSKINECLVHLRPSEQKVARFIINDLNFAANAPINELADKAGVSHASITRLARALGCTNVRELKLRLAQSAAIGERFINETPVEQKDIPAVYSAIVEILQLNAGLISEQMISTAANLMINAPRVVIFGVGGGSSIMAQEVHNRLFRLCVQSNAYSDPLLMRMTAASVDKGDVVLCLSLTGYSPDVEAAVQIARDYGSQIIAICPASRLSKLADVHLPILTQESDFIYKPSASRYVMLAAIDILASQVAVLNQRKSREKLRRIKHELDEHRQGPERLPLGD